MRILLLLLPLALTACASNEPYERQGTWHNTGINDANLAAMVANPADLQRGRQSQEPDSPLAIDAVTRLWAGKPKPLPATTSSATSVQPSNTNGGSGSGGASAGGS